MRRALLPVLLLVACGEDMCSDLPMPSPAAMAVDEACDEVAKRVCNGLNSCECRLDVRGYADVAACVAARRESCRGAFAVRVLPDMEAEKAKLDRDALARCTGEIEKLAQTCQLAGTKPLPAACDALFIDVAPIGEPCRIEGSGIVFCGDGKGICTSADPKRCEALPAAGSPCAQGFCAAGAICLEGACVAPGAGGAGCGANEACAAGLVCVAGKCAAPVEKDGACDRTEACRTGLRCDSGKCVDASALGAECSGADACGAGRGCAVAPETRTCKDPATKGELCATGDCAVGLVCDSASGTCIDPPEEGRDCSVNRSCADGFACSDGDQKCHRLPEAGETCFVGERFCRDGLGCRESSNTCEEGGGEGAACLLNPPDYVCGAGFGCDFASSTCKALGGAGTACETDRTCSRETYCENGKCAARKPEGSACPDGAGCAPGLTCMRKSGAWTCVKTPARGESCEFECAGGLRCRGAGGTCAPRFCLVP